MGRSKKSKKPRRAAKRAIYASGEGKTEEAFLKYMKARFSTRDDNLSITVQNQNGGAPLTILESSIRKARYGSYDVKFVLMDSDQQWPEDLDVKARDSGFHLINSAPCIEALLLRILDSTKEYQNWSTDRCKNEFEKNHLDAISKLDHRNYEVVFGQVDWINARNRIPELDKLFEIMFDGKIKK